MTEIALQVKYRTEDPDSFKAMDEKYLKTLLVEFMRKGTHHVTLFGPGQIDLFEGAHRPEIKQMELEKFAGWVVDFIRNASIYDAATDEQVRLELEHARAKRVDSES